MKENIEIQATSFERIRPYRMNEASENGEVSAAIESMGKHGSINSYFYVKLSAQLLAQLPAFKNDSLQSVCASDIGNGIVCGDHRI